MEQRYIEQGFLLSRTTTEFTQPTLYGHGQHAREHHVEYRLRQRLLAVDHTFGRPSAA